MKELMEEKEQVNFLNSFKTGSSSNGLSDMFKTADLKSPQAKSDLSPFFTKYLKLMNDRFNQPQ